MEKGERMKHVSENLGHNHARIRKWQKVLMVIINTIQSALY
jgi:hypothetical protein